MILFGFVCFVLLVTLTVCLYFLVKDLQADVKEVKSLLKGGVAIKKPEPMPVTRPMAATALVEAPVKEIKQPSDLAAEGAAKKKRGPLTPEAKELISERMRAYHQKRKRDLIQQHLAESAPLQQPPSS